MKTRSQNHRFSTWLPRGELVEQIYIAKNQARDLQTVFFCEKKTPRPKARANGQSQIGTTHTHTQQAEPKPGQSQRQSWGQSQGNPEPTVLMYKKSGGCLKFQNSEKISS